MPMLHSHGAQELSNGNYTESGIATSRFSSVRDSMEYITYKTRADNSTGYRILVSVEDRQLYVVNGKDTLLTAPVAVGSGVTLEHNGKEWNFSTPRSVRKVVGKRDNPVWTPPEWHYAELAKSKGFELQHLQVGKPIALKDGTMLTIKSSKVGILTGSDFQPLPTDEEIVFDGVLYVPPIGTENRRIPGELGKYGLEIGDGFLFHGTPHLDSIGQAASHGCIRMRDDDIAWLFDHVPVGTKVYIF